MPGRAHVADETAVERENLHLAGHVLQVAGDQLVVDQRRPAQGRLGLRDDFLPVLRLRVGQLDGHQPMVRGIRVGGEVEQRIDVADEVELVLEVGDHVDRRGVGLGQVADHYPRAVALLGGDLDHQIAAVVGHAAPVAPLRLLGAVIDQHVGRLGRADAVVAELVVEVQRLVLGARLGLGRSGRRRSPCRPWSTTRRPNLVHFSSSGSRLPVAISMIRQVCQSDPASERA